jgi:F0F1-type ATP synthase assembly protein I
MKTKKLNNHIEKRADREKEKLRSNHKLIKEEQEKLEQVKAQQQAQAIGVALDLEGIIK